MAGIGISDGNVVFSRAAGESLASDQFKLVKVDTDAGIDLCDATTDFPIGVLLNDPAAGEACEILHSGRGKVKIGGTVTAGQLLGPDAAGLAIAVTADTKTYCAIALESGVANDVIEAAIVPVSHIAG